MHPYNDTQPKEEQVREMFDGIAPRYDLLNHTLSLGIDRYWRRRLVKAVRRAGPQRILDLASGTGDVAIAMARKMSEACIVAADISEGMLDVARRKISERGLSGRISLKAAPAEGLPFEDREFDAVTVAFGVRNFADIASGLREASRVTAPGGRIFILEFSMPSGKFFAPLYRLYFRRVLPGVGGLISGDGDAYGYLPASVEEFPRPRNFMRLLEENGFKNASAKPMTQGVAVLYMAEKE